MDSVQHLTPVHRRIPPLPLQSSLTTPRLRRPRLSVSLTPASSAGDRFIPNRRKSNVDEAHFLVTCPDATFDNMRLHLSSSTSSSSSSSSSSNSASIGQLMPPPPPVAFSPTKTFDQAVKPGYRRRLEFLRDNGEVKQITCGDSGNAHRILSFSGSETRKQPEAAIYSNSTVIDWSCNNEIVVALDTAVFKWNASTKFCEDVPLRLNEGDATPVDGQSSVTAVAWDPQSKYLAIGFETGRIELWDSVTRKTNAVSSDCVCQHGAAIYAIVWNGFTSLFSASACGCVAHYDVRSSRAYTVVDSATELRCALAVSGDGQHLAIAGATGIVIIYSIADQCRVRTIEAHTDTVKAMAWCPWQTKVLATAGGIHDGRICLWKNSNGALMSHVDTKSQVCCMVWAPKHRELITGHGVTYTDIIIWKYPSLHPVARLRGHRSRVLGLVLSPSNTVLASCAADELLMLWNCFDGSPPSPATPRDKWKAVTRASACCSPFMTSIR